MGIYGLVAPPENGSVPIHLYTQEAVSALEFFTPSCMQFLVMRSASPGLSGHGWKYSVSPSGQALATGSERDCTRLLHLGYALAQPMSQEGPSVAPGRLQVTASSQRATLLPVRLRLSSEAPQVGLRLLRD